MEKAKERVEKQRQAQLDNRTAEKEVQQEKTKRSEKEQRLFELAYEAAEYGYTSFSFTLYFFRKMLYQDELAKAAAKGKSLVKPDPSIGSLLNTESRLNIFTTLEGTKEAPLGFWDDWDLRAARFESVCSLFFLGL